MISDALTGSVKPGIILTLFLALLLVPGEAQDSQFSQFYANPLYLNPALTGSHAGTFRLTANYRTQWGASLEKPFTTLSAGGDIKFPIQSGEFSKGNDILAAGLLFFTDRQALFEYNTNAISLFTAFHKILSKETNQYLSAGFQLGLGQRGVNYENLTFEDQFDGVNQYNLPTSEILPGNSIAYPDFSLGIHYSITPNTNRGVYVGLSYHHWNQPNISFFDRDTRTTEEYEGFNLDSKITGHVSTSFPINRQAAIQPRAIFIKQGQASTAWLGGSLKGDLENSNDVSLHFGFWVRASDDLTGFEPTDFVLSFAYEKSGLIVGISYDSHLRKLSSEWIGRGTIEFSISYVGEHENENEICPEF